MNVLVAGHTGLTGAFLVDQLLENPKITRVFTWGRRPLERQTEKLVHLGFMEGSNPQIPSVSIAFCTLGTTIRKAGSREAFKDVDVRLVSDFAHFTRQCGARYFVLQSSVGADKPRGNFYLSCKAEAEKLCASLGFEGVYIVRPSILGGQRSEFRFGERVGLALMRAMNGLIPKRYRVVEAETVASAMVRLGLTQTPGVWIKESEDLADLAKRAS